MLQFAYNRHFSVKICIEAISIKLSLESIDCHAVSLTALSHVLFWVSLQKFYTSTDFRIITLSFLHVPQ